MKKKKSVFLLLSLITFSINIICCTAFSEEENNEKILPKLNFEIAVSLDVQDKNIETLISSLVKREIRALNDVTYIDDAKQSSFVLQIRQIDVRAGAGNLKTGNAISWVMYRNQFKSKYFNKTTNLIQELIGENTKPERKELLLKLLNFYLNHNIMLDKELIFHNAATCGDDGLGQIVQHIIAGADEGVFEETRKFRRGEIKKLEEEGYKAIEKGIEEEPLF